MVSYLLTIMATGAGIGGAVLAFFWKVEDVASPEAKAAISAWLKRLDPVDPQAHWRNQFVALFDQIFGKRHLSLSCFARSCLASSGAVVIVSILYLTMNIDYFWRLLYEARRPGQLLEGLFLFLSLILMLNWFPDYISLLKTRYLLRYIKGLNKLSTIAFLAADIVLTITIFCAGILIIFFPVATAERAWGRSFFSFLSSYLGRIGDLPEIVNAAITLDHEVIIKMGEKSYKTYEFPFGIFLYSSFFTSVWLWLHAIAGIMIRSISFAAWFFDIDGYPVRSLGMIAASLAFLGYLVLALSTLM